METTTTGEKWSGGACVEFGIVLTVVQWQWRSTTSECNTMDVTQWMYQLDVST